ncbi:5'/3'-nucleotidase SurE [Streptomyces sp. NPDC088812]|uniref:5'/3'-nucleotidase SurE n=1 Tax=Streptomyces sp. NPDC088812 TaxID=3365905 RepID=UPI00381B4D3C
METTQRVLVTNDDGIFAIGLRRLARAMADCGHDVVVAAPATEMSGSSASLGAVLHEGRVAVERRELEGLAGIPAHGVAATPACVVVLAASGAFGPPPGIVLSGVNLGTNAGHAILHSGTVGAAVTAADNGLRAIAVSLDALSAVEATAGRDTQETDAAWEESRHWETATGFVRRLMTVLPALPARTVLNLNVPDKPAEEVRELTRASLAPFGTTQMVATDEEGGFVRLTAEENGAQPTPGTDLALLGAGHATVTPVRPVGEMAGIELPL